MTCLLRSAGITPLPSLLQSNPPLTGASVLSASRLAPLPSFPLVWHRRVGSHAPYESLVEHRATYMPDVLAVTRIAVAGAHCRAHRNSRSCYFRLEEVGNRLNGSIRAIAFHHAVTPRNQIRTPPIWRGDEVAPHF